MATKRQRSGTAAHRLPLSLLYLLSLDAVAVLLAYQWALGRWAGVEVPLRGYAYLAVGIWLGYVADRLLDVRWGPELHRGSRRHDFHRMYRPFLQVAWMGFFLVAWATAPFLLSVPQLLTGVTIGMLATLYVWLASRRGMGGERIKRTGAVLLLTLAGGWWVWAGFAGGAEPPGSRVWMLVPLAFALAAWWNLTLLHREESGREALGLAADGALAVGFLLLGWAGPWVG